MFKATKSANKGYHYLFGLCQGGATLPQVLLDDVEPSCTGCTSGPPPPCHLGVKLKDGTGRMFWRETFEVAEPADTALGCKARGRGLLCSPSDLFVGDVLCPMYALDGS